MHAKDSERFWKSVNKSWGCWEWIGYLDQAGYGRISIKHYPYKTHRVSWEIEYGEIPKGLCVCHKCDNRKCVKPAHLFLGTHLDNQLDKIRKGRGVNGQTHPKFCGESSGHNKLTEKQVLAIREIYSFGTVSTGEIARIFRVGKSTVKHIIHRRTWKHL